MRAYTIYEFVLFATIVSFYAFIYYEYSENIKVNDKLELIELRTDISYTRLKNISSVCNELNIKLNTNINDAIVLKRINARLDGVVDAVIIMLTLMLSGAVVIIGYVLYLSMLN